MAWRLRLVPEKTNINFFRLQWITFGISVSAMIASVILILTIGLNFGIDFRGGTTIRTESTTAVDVAAYRDALSTVDAGDVSITEVFDPSFRDDQHVAMVRLSARDGEEAVTPEVIAEVEAALKAIDPAITFPSMESVGPKVSSELITSAVSCGPGRHRRDSGLCLVPL
jgi:preprotein translocase subunit SecF